jgi:hypothetical protein
MSTETKNGPAARAEDKREKLQERYKPLGLRAVAAAMQCKPAPAKADERRERDIPAVLRPIYD